MNLRLGFFPGVLAGAVFVLAGLWLTAPAAAGGELSEWVTRNLGHSSWLFAAVLVLFVVHLSRLRGLLAQDGGVAGQHRAVVELDQLTDVWIHLFVGIGVVWTAVGMRAALQTALADTDRALTDTAGSVLGKLVDGGILLALSTTIVGAVGGYLLRLGKTVYTGAALHQFYQREQRQDLRDILAALERLEHQAPAGAISAVGAVSRARTATSPCSHSRSGERSCGEGGGHAPG